MPLFAQIAAVIIYYFIGYKITVAWWRFLYKHIFPERLKEWIEIHFLKYLKAKDELLFEMERLQHEREFELRKKKLEKAAAKQLKKEKKAAAKLAKKAKKSK